MRFDKFPNSKQWLLSIVCVAWPMLLNAQAPLHSKQELYQGKEFKKAFAQPKDRPDKPNVLLIGDSISIGYTVSVRMGLAQKADVFRIPRNGQATEFGVQKLDGWLKGKKWDVIHFNWGLWDLCYRHPESKVQGKRDKEKGMLTTSPEDYEKNLRTIVARLKKTGAKLIWCATTPVPEGEAGRFKGDAAKYNKIAEHVMKENDIYINDLYSFAKKKLPSIQTKKGDVHFTKDGYRYLGEGVAKTIENTL